MSVTDIAVLIDWRHARRTLSDLVARLRPQYIEHSGDVDARPMASISAGMLTITEMSYGTMQLGEVKL